MPNSLPPWPARRWQNITGPARIQRDGQGDEGEQRQDRSDGEASQRDIQHPLGAEAFRGADRPKPSMAGNTAFMAGCE